MGGLLLRILKYCILAMIIIIIIIIIVIIVIIIIIIIIIVYGIITVRDRTNVD